MPVEMMLQFFSVIVCLRFFISHAKNKYTQNIDHSHSCGQSHFNEALWYAPFYEIKIDFELIRGLDQLGSLDFMNFLYFFNKYSE